MTDEYALRVEIRSLKDRLAWAAQRVAQADADARADVTAVRSLHHVDVGGYFDSRDGEYRDSCHGCGELWPCKTTRALDRIPNAATGGDAA